MIVKLSMIFCLTITINDTDCHLIVFELLFDTLIFENALERELGKKIISFFQ